MQSFYYRKTAIEHTLNWLFFDIHNLASTYRHLDDRDNMCKVYKLEHDLLNTLSYYGGNYIAYYFQSTIRLAQHAAQKNKTEQCFGYLEEMMSVFRRLRIQKEQRIARNCILFDGRDERSTAKVSKSTVLKCLKWKSFDSIRSTSSFCRIYNEINSWDD